MARKIIWTKRANSKMASVIEYLEKNWGERVCAQFLKTTFHLVELLSEQPNIGTSEMKDRKIRGLVISKHNKIFYRVTPSKIVILNIFDSRTNPQKNPYKKD